MSLRHAILGVLKDGPTHGYHVLDELERRVPGGRYSNAQVYQGLRWLAERGFVVQEALEPGLNRDRRPFGLAAKGLREFERWLRGPFVPARAARDENIVRIVFLAARDVSQLKEALERLKRHHLRRLSMTKPGRFPRTNRLDEMSHALAAAALRFREEAELRWIDHCVAQLDGSLASSESGVAAQTEPGAAGTFAVRTRT